MPQEYTSEERELIDLITDISAIPELSEDSRSTDRVAELLIKNIGNKEFNKKLARHDSGDNHNEENATYFLYAFTHKTKDYDANKASVQKFDVAIKSQAQNQPLEEYEKLTLSEYGKVSTLASIHDKYQGLIGYIAEHSDNQDFKNASQTMSRASSMKKGLEKKALSTGQYKSGDLSMYLTPKTTAIKGKNSAWMGHEGKLEEAFLTKYNHAAPLYVNNMDPENPVVTKSDVWSLQRSDELKINEILESDTFRIDPVKMVSKKQAKKLEQVDYGYQQGVDGNDLIGEDGNKVKQTWQNVMRERYEQLSYALHVEQIPHKVYEMDLKKEKFQEELSELYAIELWDRTENDEAWIDYLEGEVEVLEGRSSELGEYKLRNDAERLESVANWVGPEAVIKGHNKWFAGDNSVREMSQKMFNATPDQSVMICSEFAARSIASSMDQLNRITALDLYAAGLTENREEKVVKNPISKHERLDRVHPGRLVSILEKAGCVEKVENKFLSQIMQTENVSKSKVKDLDYKSKLPKKIYSILEKSSSLEDFQKKSNIAFKTYLESEGVDRGVVHQVKEHVLDNKLPEIYAEHKKEPKGIMQKIAKTCKRALEFCKLISKDKATKKNLGNLVEDISNDIKAVEGQKKAPPPPPPLPGGQPNDLQQSAKDLGVQIIPFPIYN